MFALSWVFLAAAIASLVFGLSQSGLTFIWISIAASVLAMLFMLAGVLRRPVRPATAGAPYGPPPDEAARRPAAREDRPTRPAERPSGRAAASRPTSTAATTEVIEPEPEPAPPVRKPAAKKPAAKKPAAKAPAKTSTEKKTAAARSTSDRSQVLALPERGTYHLSECRIVKGRRDTEKITRGTAKRRGYSACGICKPAA